MISTAGTLLRSARTGVAWLLSVMLVLVVAGGCERTSSTTQGRTSTNKRVQAERGPVLQPLMWAVVKDGKTSHVMGTMHAGVDPARLPAWVWETLEGSRAVAFETDLAGAASLPVVRTDGSSLRDELGDAYWQKLEQALGEEEAARLVSFKPVIAATLVASVGLPDTASMDSELEARAKARGIRVVYLESIGHQFSVLEKWLDLRALKDMLDDVEVGRQTSQALLAAFEAGDEARTLGVLAAEKERWIARGRPAAEYDAQMEDLLYRRNASWIDAIEKMHADGGGFVAVGAAHTVGPRSVVELLRERGYSVTRITR